MLCVDGRGKAADAGRGGVVEELVSQGQVVLSIDARGFGETADAARNVVYVKGDHRPAMWSMHVGKSLLGQRVEDVLAAFTYVRSLPKIDPDKVKLIGVGRAGPVALHAGVLDGRFASLILRDSIGSWVDDVVARPKDIHAITHVVPSALLQYDLPDLVDLLGDKVTVE